MYFTSTTKVRFAICQKKGRNLITAAIPEIGQTIAGKKKLKSAAKDSLQKSVSKTISESTTADRSRPRPPKRLRSTHASRGRGSRVTAPSARHAAGRSATQSPLSTNKLEIRETNTYDASPNHFKDNQDETQSIRFFVKRKILND